MDNVQALTGANLTSALLVAVALAGVFVLFANVVEAARKLRRPQQTQEHDLVSHQEACGRKFAHDQRLLIEHGSRIASLEEASRVQCAALHALLEHELHNGNADEMKKASAALFDHLNKR